jgi:topoisomerase IV subunit A
MSDSINNTLHVDDLYQKWFLEYASYVNLDRAIPHIDDGLKPVQRRILHAMKEQDDGRYTKVANLIGQTMQYHPHGDASIGDALVKIGQKELMIDTQGNWGDVRTGDGAAAPRYIEARLTPFALHTAFNEDNTEWQRSYDGRKREPVKLPVKFPLLLAHGAEGIGVGLRSYILPHNFIELCEASIAIIKNKKFEIFPDFITGGFIDVSNYQNGLQGGKVKCRAKIEKDDKNLKITSVPFSETTGSIIDSILAEIDKGRLKIKKVIDNTSSDVEILIELHAGVSPDLTMDALYAFTKCEISLSPLGCCIVDERPMFLGVDDMLRISTKKTVELLLEELNIQQRDLENKWHFLSLEKIFFEEKIYKELEKKHDSWEKVLDAIEKAFQPFIKKLKREVTKEDYEKLTEKPVRRIYKLDIDDLQDKINKLENDIKNIKGNISNINEFAIEYFKNLITKYGKGKERKAEIRRFEQIEVKSVAVNNHKLYVNYKEGFIGHGIKKEEFVCECTDIDDILVIRRDGRMVISRISDKKFVGKDILHVGVWKKDDERTIYNLIYAETKSNKNFVKRFNVTSITRDKEYEVAKGENCKVLYLTVNPNGEAEVVNIKLNSSSKARIKVFDFDFASVIVKGRSSQGNTISTYPIHKIELKKAGLSTLGGVKVWLDKSVGRINKNKYGQYLGEFFAEDLMLTIQKNGCYQIQSVDNIVKVDMDTLSTIEKFNPEKPISAVYYDGASKNYYVKRFLIETREDNKLHSFISDHKESKLVFVSTSENPLIEIEVLKGKSKEKLNYDIDIVEFIDVKGWKAQGNRLTQYDFKGKLKDRTTYVELVEEVAVVEEDKKKEFDELPTPEFKDGVQGTLF